MLLFFTRREMLGAMAALPLAGCALDSSGLPSVFDGPSLPPLRNSDYSLVLNVIELKDVFGTDLYPYTVEVKFAASIAYLGVRSRVHTFSSQDWVPNPNPDPGQPGLSPLPIKVEDNQIIALAESGFVMCRVTFFYGSEVSTEKAEAMFFKQPNNPVQEFTLSVDENNKYVVT